MGNGLSDYEGNKSYAKLYIIFAVYGWERWFDVGTCLVVQH